MVRYHAMIRGSGPQPGCGEARLLDNDDTASTATTASGTASPPSPGWQRQGSGPSLLQRRGINFLARPKLNIGAVVQESTQRDPFPVSKTSVWERYSLVQRLGEGSTGVVYSARQKEDSQEVALKVMRMHDEELLVDARKEFELLRSIEHRHIIRARDFFTYSMGAVLVLDLFRGESLETAVRNSADGRLSEVIARPLFAALLDAVNYLHQHGIIHRDVKAQNVLVSSDLADLRLIDFNIARRTTSAGTLTMTGTADYMPPEALLGEALTEAADVWSAGLCLHLMLSGALPLERNLFPSHEDFGLALLRGRGRRAPLSGPRWSSLALSGPCLAVLGQCLEADHHRRATAAAAQSCAWLSSPPRLGRA